MVSKKKEKEIFTKLNSEFKNETFIDFNIGAILEDFSYIFKSGFKNPITDILKVHNHKIEYVSN